MRTTLDIDDDVLDAARELAKAEGKTAGKILSELARKALTTPEFPASGLSERNSEPLSDWPTFPNREGPIVTNEMVRKIQDEIDAEEGVPWDFETNEPRRFDDHKPTPVNKHRARRRKSAR